MKHVKHLLVAALTVFLAAVLAVPAFAEGTTYTVTINKNSTDKVAHTYGAYQLFKGDLANKDGKDVLSNVQWGDNANSATIISELKKLSDFSSLSDYATASEVAKAISDKAYTTDSDGAKALAEALNKGITGNPKGTASIAADGTNGTITGLAAGYYLVKDTTAISGEGAETKYILEVVKNVSVNEKASVPSVDKEIAETNEAPTKVSDYNIGDSIPYTITGTLPSEFAKFETYTTFTFTDTMSKGLTPPADDAVTVKVGNDDITSLFDVTITDGTDGAKVLTVSLKSGVDLKTATHGENVKFAANDAIVVSYSATLNEDAVIGGTGNVNTVTLTFTNNPNAGGDGTPGTTPEDKTVVFTYEIKALKVEPTSDAAINKEAYDALSDAEKANYYKVSENEFQKVQSLEGAGFTLYKADGTTVVKEIAAGDTTEFEFKGVDAGTYVLKETTVPSGYNKVADITITVTATYDETTKPATIKTLTCSPDSFTATVSTGIVEGKILNQKGSTLPETGGMGTTILYVVGGCMVAAGVVMFLTKRRMASLEK